MPTAVDQILSKTGSIEVAADDLPAVPQPYEDPWWMKVLKLAVCMGLGAILVIILQGGGGYQMDIRTSSRYKEDLRLIQNRSRAQLYSVAPTILTDFRDGNPGAWSFGFADYSPSAYLFNDGNFLVFYTLLLGFTCILTGVGLEYHVGSFVVQVMTDEYYMIAWKGAQLCFPLFVSVAAFEAQRRSAIGLPLLVLGLYKFGFPEIVSRLYYAFYGGNGQHWLLRLSMGIDGASLFIHHGVGCMVICSLCTGLLIGDRNLQAVVMPLIVQHWCPLLKYHHKIIYALLELCFEVWWQLEVYSNMDSFPKSGQIMCYMMVGAHYGFWISPLLAVIHEVFFANKMSQSKRSLYNASTDTLDVMLGMNNAGAKSGRNMSLTPKKGKAVRIHSNKPETLKKMRKKSPLARASGILKAAGNVIENATEGYVGSYVYSDVPSDQSKQGSQFLSTHAEASVPRHSGLNSGIIPGLSGNVGGFKRASMWANHRMKHVDDNFIGALRQRRNSAVSSVDYSAHGGGGSPLFRPRTRTRTISDASKQSPKPSPEQLSHDDDINLTNSAIFHELVKLRKQLQALSLPPKSSALLPSEFGPDSSGYSNDQFPDLIASTTANLDRTALAFDGKQNNAAAMSASAPAPSTQRDNLNLGLAGRVPSAPALQVQPASFDLKLPGGQGRANRDIIARKGLEMQAMGSESASERGTANGDNGMMIQSALASIGTVVFAGKSLSMEEIIFQLCEVMQEDGIDVTHSIRETCAAGVSNWLLTLGEGSDKYNVHVLNTHRSILLEHVQRSMEMLELISGTANLDALGPATDSLEQPVLSHRGAIANRHKDQ